MDLLLFIAYSLYLPLIYLAPLSTGYLLQGLKLSIVFLANLKLLFYLRLFPNLAFITQMLFAVLYALRHFLLFFLLFLIFFT